MLKQNVFLSVFFLTLGVVLIEGHLSQSRLSDGNQKELNRVKRKAETFALGKYVAYADIDDETDLCDNPDVDALIILKDSTTFAFRKSYYWKIVKDKIEPGYPKLISESWPGLPSHLDAAFTYKDDQIFFFKGSKYWRFTGMKCDEGYPKYIDEGFPGIPNDIDAVTTWGKKEHIYFFKGEFYWRYEPKCEKPVKKMYPKLISEVWDGIPDDLNEALLHTNGYTYFLKGYRYWRFKDEKLSVDDVHGEEPYPYLISPFWFGCKLEP